MQSRSRPRRIGRFSKVAMAFVAPVLVLIFPVSASAAPLRSTSTFVTCSPMLIRAGTTASCSVTVRDVSLGAASSVTGSVSVSGSSSGAFAVGGNCALASGQPTLRCNLTVLLNRPGFVGLNVTFTPTDGTHASSVSNRFPFIVLAAPSPSVYVSQDANNITVGDQVDVYGTGCMIGGSPGYMGEFVAIGADPSGMTIDEPGVGAFQTFETLTGPGGSFDWHPIANAPIEQTFYARWYCSSHPASGLDDPNVTWVSPLTSMTLHGPAPAAST